MTDHSGPAHLADMLERAGLLAAGTPPTRVTEGAPHLADPSCRCGGPRCGTRFSALGERADRRTT